MKNNKAKAEKHFKLPLPIPHVILLAIIIFYTLVYLVTFHLATSYKYEDMVSSMTTDQKMEYVLSLSDDEFNDVITNVTEDTAKELLQLYAAYNILQAQEADEFKTE